LPRVDWLVGCVQTNNLYLVVSNASVRAPHPQGKAELKTTASQA
jgi:hypothetical protein